jgi:hypothetical protein
MPQWILPPKAQVWQDMTRKIAQWIPQIGGPDVPVILAQNVADYYYAGNDQEMWSLTNHFPNLAPPFDAFWIEHGIPKYIRSTKGDVANTWCVGGRVGFLFMVADPSTVKLADGALPEGTRWIYMIEMFADYNQGRGIEGPHGSWFLCIDEQGGLLGTPWSQGFSMPYQEEEMKAFFGWCHPALLTICFLHCKNVLVTENPPSPKFAKRYQERNEIRPVTYKTLVIEPLKAILRKEGAVDSKGVAHAMHICRGHFKDYRQGKGLFGKYHQLVWHPQVVRGTKGESVPPREIEVKV